MTARPPLGFDLGSTVAAATAVHKAAACQRCQGSGRILIKADATGRLFDICPCPAGQESRDFIDQEEQRLTRDEQRRERAAILRGDA